MRRILSLNMMSSWWIVLIVILFYLPFVSSIEPSGAQLNVGSSNHSVGAAPTGVAAYAGNVTEVNIRGSSVTQAWQGYFGNVSGTILLGTGSNNVMYNWTLASPRGEVFASTNSTIYWNNVQCFNFTADGTQTGGEVSGNISLHGTNLTTLETQYGINMSDVDGVNETFAYTGASGHKRFFVNNQEFSAGECWNTQVYDSSGHGNNGIFEEVLLYEPQSTSIIFTALLEQDRSGFDQAQHDFELLVLENGHQGDVSSTTYYFYVELE